MLAEAEARWKTAVTDHEARTRRHGEACMLLEECTQRAISLQVGSLIRWSVALCPFSSALAGVSATATHTYTRTSLVHAWT